MLKIKKYRKFRDHCNYTGEYKGAAHNICNLKYSVPKEIPITFQNKSNYDYHFIIKELAEEFEKQFTCLEENTAKYINFSVPVQKAVTRIDKNGEEITKPYVTDYNLLIAQEFWQVHYQILLIILLNEFMKLNISMNMMIKYSKSKVDLIEYKFLCCNNNYKNKFHEK